MGLSGQVCQHGTVEVGQAIVKAKENRISEESAPKLKAVQWTKPQWKAMGSDTSSYPFFLFFEQDVSSLSESQESGVREMFFDGYVQEEG